MWRWCVMVAVMTVMALQVAASDDEFLLSDCRVEGFEANLKFNTYDDNVSLHLTREKTTAIPVIVIRQDGNNEWRFLLRKVTRLWKWEDVELQLSEKPKVFLNGEQVDATGSQEDMKKKMWEVEIENAWAYARCQKRWPVLELDSTESRNYFEISRSGPNEKIKLLPIEATNVRLSVGEQEKMLCQEGDNVVVKDYDSTQTCPNLNPNTFTEEIDITVNNEEDSIKIRKEGLTGVLYIVQCVDDCVLPVPTTTAPPTTTTAPGPTPPTPLPSNYYVMMGFMILFIFTTVGLAVLLRIWKK